jgi:hypothetical protein
MKRFAKPSSRTPVAKASLPGTPEDLLQEAVEKGEWL